MPTEQQPRPTIGEPAEDLLGLTTQDLWIVERATEREEGDVERDRYHDQQQTRPGPCVHQPSFDDAGTRTGAERHRSCHADARPRRSMAARLVRWTRSLVDPPRPASIRTSTSPSPISHWC